MAALEEVTYDLARQALADQASTVEGLRSRCGPLVAAAVAVAGLLATAATEDAHGVQLVLAAVGFASGLVAIVAAANVLRPRKFGFSIDSVGLYEAASAEREHPEIYYVRLAATLREMRSDNEATVERLHRYFAAALGGLLIEALGLTIAVAVR